MNASAPGSGRQNTSIPGSPGASQAELAAMSKWHVRFGWWLTLFFLTLGIALEGLHGFKIGWYLDVTSEARRLMWTLAHAHGTMLGLVTIAFGLTLRFVPADRPLVRSIASPCLLAAAVLLPLGFLLGGLFLHGRDPGLGVLLVPVGAILLFVAVLITARSAASSGDSPSN